jgi:hypothetical protein
MARRLLGCAVALLAVACAASPARAATIVVTDFSDSPTSPPPGSLRAAVGAAKSGDTITFATPSVVSLATGIVIPKDKRRLTIAGPAQLRPAQEKFSRLVILGAGVTIRDITFQEMSVQVSAPNVKLAGDTFSLFTDTRGSGALEIDTDADRASVTDSTLSTSVIPGIEVSGDDVRIANSKVSVPGGNLAIDANAGGEITIEGNTLEGAIRMNPRKRGKVAGNTMTIPVADYGGIPLKGTTGIEVGSDDGPVSIEGNRLNGGSITLRRANVRVVRNKISDGDGIKQYCGADHAPAMPVITANEMTGGYRGIEYHCSPKQAPRARIALNKIVSSDFEGIVIQGGRNLDLRNNTVTGSGKHGIHFKPGTQARLTGGTISQNGGAGVFVDRGAAVRISRTSFSANAGPGIDLFPAGVTPNPQKKQGNDNVDWPEPPQFDPAKNRVKGTACRGCIIEVFFLEGGGRTGNPKNGEGVKFAGQVKADSRGKWFYPRRGGVVPRGEASDRHHGRPANHQLLIRPRARKRRGSPRKDCCRPGSCRPRRSSWRASSPPAAPPSGRPRACSSCSSR